MTNSLSVSLLKDATVLSHGPREFLRVFWHFLRHGETITCEITNRESVVKLLHSASSLVLCTTRHVFCSQFIKHIRLTHDE